MKIENIFEHLPNEKDELFLKTKISSLLGQEFSFHDKMDSFFKKNTALFLDAKTKEESLKTSFFNTKNHKYICIDKNYEKPLNLVFLLKQNDTIFENSLHLHIKRGVKVKIVEIMTNRCENSALLLNRFITLEEDSNLEYLKLQDINKSNFCVYNVAFSQSKASQIEFTNLEYGDGAIFNIFENAINERDIFYKLSTLAKLQNKSHCVNLFITTHKDQNSQSEISFKSTLEDESFGVLKARSIVKENALFTKAHQNAHNILLSDNARILSEPHLEIFTDELQASHGATTGSLDKEQLLYLQSRGINEKKATKMLLDAFEKEVIESINDEKLKDIARRYSRKDYV